MMAVLHHLKPRIGRMTSRLHCGWFKGFRLDDRDRHRGQRYTAKHVNVKGVHLKTEWTDDKDKVTCRRCQFTMRCEEHEARQQRVDVPPRRIMNNFQVPVMPEMTLTVPRDPNIAPVPIRLETVQVQTDFVTDGNVWGQSNEWQGIDWGARQENGYTVLNAYRDRDSIWSYALESTNTTVNIGGVLTATDTWNTWTTTDSTAGVWDLWVDAGTDAATSNVSFTWGAWNDDFHRVLPAVIPAVAAIDNAQRHVFQRGRGPQYSQRDEDAYQREQRERKAQAQEAQEKAEKLLVEHSSPVQKDMWEREGRMICRGTDGRRYGIRRGRLHNVSELDVDGKEVNTLCGGPFQAAERAGYLPESDVILGQLLHLQYNTEEFRRVANITRAYEGSTWPKEEVMPV